MKPLALAMLLACSAAEADTLTYQSQTLPGTSDEVDGGIDLGAQPLNDSYLVTLNIQGSLPPNLNFAPITPQSWSVTCQNCLAYLSSSPSDIPQGMLTATSAVFMFSTDSAGRITNWSFAINGSLLLPDGEGGYLRQGSGSFASSPAGDSALSKDEANGHQYTQVNAGQVGGWTQPAVQPAVTKIQPSVRLWFHRL